jgi:hypothetical protein
MAYRKRGEILGFDIIQRRDLDRDMVTAKLRRGDREAWKRDRNSKGAP